MSTYLIATAFILVLGVAVFLMFKYYNKDEAKFNSVFTLTFVVSTAVATMFKGKEGKTDIKDILEAVSVVASSGASFAAVIKSGGDFNSVKEDLKRFVRAVVDHFPEVKDKITDDVIAKEVEAAYLVLSVVGKK